MPVYKDAKNNTWYCKFYYEDYTRKKKQKLKRGFKLKKEAQEYEREFLTHYQRTPDIAFTTLVNHYKEDMRTRLKESTARTREFTINTHILPYFRDFTMDQITPGDVRRWQNEILKKKYAQTYASTINKALVTLLNHAVRYYGLSQNPASLAGSIGSKKTEKEMNILTLDQFNELIEKVDHIEIKTVLIILFYTGIRLGELQALTWNDIDFENKKINVNKTYARIKKKDLITSPKTRKSIRTVSIPSIVVQAIQEYKNSLYEPKNRVFKISRTSIRDTLTKLTKELGFNHVRIHDLRHSHASLLINNGINILAISERLGHDSINTTLETYSHLYPKSSREVDTLLENLTKEKNK